MNTKTPEFGELEKALQSIPKQFRDKLVKRYISLKQAQAEERYEAAGLAAGKLAEVVLRFLQHEQTGTCIGFGKSIGNFADECRKIISSNSGNLSSALKTAVPRALVFAYTIRNQRDIGHDGGDLDANPIDMATVVRISDWIICELIRSYHGLPIEEAQDLIDSISVKNVPLIWQVGEKKRVLKAGMSAKDQALVLLYSSKETSVLTEDLCDWIEYKRSMFATRVLNDLHQKRMIEYDRDNELVQISPLGVDYVEQKIL